MAKGFFTQGVVVLLRRAPSLDEIVATLRRHVVVTRTDDAAALDLAGPSLRIPYRPASNGYVAIDVQPRVWPDHMGDPRNEPKLFGAWSMGHFGPFAFPGGLQRAAAHAWSWADGRNVPSQHRAFVRVRLTYLFGARDDARVIPEDCDPAHELRFVTGVARTLLDHEAALAYFNPNGEVLADRAHLDAVLEGSAALQTLPINVWCNVRFFNAADGWFMMDTVGMAQLDQRDSEACFPGGRYEPGEVSHFLLNVGLYLAEHGDVIADGDTMDGPGGVPWRATRVDECRAEPPRAVLRWLPLDGTRPPRALVVPGGAAGS